MGNRADLKATLRCGPFLAPLRVLDRFGIQHFQFLEVGTNRIRTHCHSFATCMRSVCLPASSQHGLMRMQRWLAAARVLGATPCTLVVFATRERRPTRSL